MKATIVFLILLCTSCALSQDSGFTWPLPPAAEANKLTPGMFPGADAVLILKEQGFSEGPHTRSLFKTRNEVTVESKTVIAKVFNDAAVRQLGSFEYEYPNRRFEQAKHIFKVRARIMKPDGTLLLMPDTAVSTMTGTESGRGRALTNKVLFKLNNLTPGDVVQIEYSHFIPFSFTRQVLFFYHDRYPVLTSTVNIMMDDKEKVDYLNFPADKITASEPEELHVVTSRSWTVKNLAQIPPEPFGRPFEDVSYMTAIIDHSDEEDGNGWRPLAKDFVKYYINEGSVPRSFMREIGLNPSLQEPAWADIEQAYTALRKYFRIQAVHSRYPDSKNITDLIGEKEANPTNLAFIMLKMLERWGVPVTPLLIRDRRQGVYETSVSSVVWFDRLGLLVSLGGTDKVFDFDRCIPTRFEHPWFLNGTSALALYDTGAAHMSVRTTMNISSHISRESHHVTLTRGRKPVDSVLFALNGAVAQRFRGELYPFEGVEIERRVRSFVGERALQDVDTVSINSFLDEWQIQLGGKGVSQAAMTEIDPFLIFQPRNHLLRALRVKFTSSERHDDIFFDERFCYSIQWSVHAPAGFAPVQLPEQLFIEGVPGVHAEVSWFMQESATSVTKADIVIDTEVIGKERYRDWLAFLDKTIKAMEHEITFKRN